MSPLNRFFYQSAAAFEAMMETINWWLTRAGDAVIYDFPYWVAQKVKRS